MSCGTGLLNRSFFVEWAWPVGWVLHPLTTLRYLLGGVTKLCKGNGVVRVAPQNPLSASVSFAPAHPIWAKKKS
jgi:hypothetical protein